jgi:CRISPR-associated protein Cas1
MIAVKKMSWRIIFIKSDSSLFLHNNSIVVKKEDERILCSMEDIDTIVIDNYKVSLTLQLINEIVEKGISIILCDKQHLPKTIIQNMTGHHRRSKKITEQINWDKSMQKYVWKKIIESKINNQSNLLKNLYGHSDTTNKLDEYSHNVEADDITNREGLAAKIYFRELFGKYFIRQDTKIINSSLNYGYSIISSKITQVITGKGYLTELGIHHISEYNQINLTSDLMEPFRPYVDYFANKYGQDVFDADTRYLLSNVLNTQIKYDEKTMYLNKAIELYCSKVLEAIETGDIEKLVFPIFDEMKEYEL